MSSATPKLLKWSLHYPIFKKIFLYYNIYIRNFKFFFKSSQFGEDDKIINLFNEKKIGIYLDIGCFHPVRQNNTYKLFKLGWNGINIDLNPLTLDLNNIARPQDINICAAISNKNSKKTLFFDHQLSSLNTLSKNHTKFIDKAFGIKNLKTKKIKTTILSNILKNKKIKEIDFMNIDIEGHEIDVLKTINFNHFHIKVLCVEIVNYDQYSKKIKINKEKIFKLLKKNNYVLKFKTSINYIFVKKKKK